MTDWLTLPETLGKMAIRVQSCSCVFTSSHSLLVLICFSSEPPNVYSMYFHKIQHTLLLIHRAILAECWNKVCSLLWGKCYTQLISFSWFTSLADWAEIVSLVEYSGELGRVTTMEFQSVLFIFSIGSWSISNMWMCVKFSNYYYYVLNYQYKQWEIVLTSQPLVPKKHQISELQILLLH